MTAGPRFGFPLEAEEREMLNTAWDELVLAKKCREAVLRNNDPPRLFRFGGNLHWIEDGRISSPMTPARFEDVLLRNTQWSKTIKKGVDVPGKLPRPVAERVHQDLVSDTAVPELLGISRIPILRRSDAQLVSSGYDAESRIAVCPPDSFEIPEVGGGRLRDVAKALCDPLREFPFCSSVDRAGALALLVTLIMRDWIDGPVPLFAIDAPAAGTGKTLLARSIGAVLLGAEPVSLGVMPPREELRKDLPARLRKAPPMIVYDNAAGTIRSESLAAYVTAGDTFSARDLGYTRELVLPARAVIVITGSNLDISGDRGELTRRYVNVRIDAGVAHPETRGNFTYPNLREHILSARSEIIAAVYTLAQRWDERGRPVPERVPKFGSFESWRHVVGGILELAGIYGLLDDLPDRLEMGEEDRQWGWFLLGLYRKSRGKPFTVAELLQWISRISGGRGEPELGSSENGGRYRSALEFPSLVESRIERKEWASKRRSIGKFLTNRVGRVYEVSLDGAAKPDLAGDAYAESLSDWARNKFGNPNRIKLTIGKREGRARKAFYAIEAKPEA